MDPRQEVRSLRKGLRALAMINHSGSSTISEVARELKIPRGTAHRLLETLVVDGYLRRDNAVATYSLTALVQQLALGFRDELWVEQVAAPIISQLGRELLWPLCLSTPRADQMMTRVTTDHDTSLTLTRYVPGFTAPLLHTTTGLCFLAFCAESEREALIELCKQSPDEKQFLARNRPALDIVLERIRADGWSILEYAQYREGNVGVPVIVNGFAIGGLVMRYIKSAIKRSQIIEQYIPRLKTAAQRISQGYCALEGNKVASMM